MRSHAHVWIANETPDKDMVPGCIFMTKHHVGAFVAQFSGQEYMYFAKIIIVLHVSSGELLIQTN